MVSCLDGRTKKKKRKTHPLYEGADVPPMFLERISERQIPDNQSDVFYVDSSTEKPLHKTDEMITIENFRELQ
jgi:hypothetical protein